VGCQQQPLQNTWSFGTPWSPSSSVNSQTSSYGIGHKMVLTLPSPHIRCYILDLPSSAVTNPSRRHGTVEGENLPLVSPSTWTLDRGQTAETWSRGERDLCFICDQEQESIDHIIATCSYIRDLWHRILHVLGRQLSQPTSTTLSWWKRLCSGCDDLQRSGMDCLFTLVS
jgi:hypothetical protein